MLRFFILALLILTGSQLSALSWQDDDLDWTGGHAYSALSSTSPENLELMLVSMRDSDDYGLYYFQFACVLNTAQNQIANQTIHMGLTVPWRNPFAGGPEHVEFTIRFEFAQGETDSQTVNMAKDPMGDDHVSWDGNFPVSQAFLAKLGRARAISILMPQGGVIKTFQTRGAGLAAATLAEYCVQTAPE